MFAKGLFLRLQLKVLLLEGIGIGQTLLLLWVLLCNLADVAVPLQASACRADHRVQERQAPLDGQHVQRVHRTKHLLRVEYLLTLHLLRLWMDLSNEINYSVFSNRSV